MSFEDSIRDHLQREADAVRLPRREPDRAVADARSRRRRRLAAAGAGAVVAVVAVAAGVAAVPGGAGDGGDRADVAVGVDLADVVPATGPLAFDWQAAGDGLYGVRTSFQAADGTVYALSSGPGFVRSDADRASAALYRLGDDGVWQPVDLESGGRPFALDVTANGEALYAVSTGPGAGADDKVTQLSVSTDGGDTWASDDLAPVAPPSDLAWEQFESFSVETVGDTTIALVTTTFHLDFEVSFPDLAGDYFAMEPDEDGILIMPVEGTPGPEGEPPPGSRTLTWAELGVSGPDDLVAHQVMRNTGSGWEPVDATGLPGRGARLGTAGGKFVAEGTAEDGSVSVSADGVAWTPVPLPQAEEDDSLMDATYDVRSFGPALVALETRWPTVMEGMAETRVLVSADAGSTWQPVDLTAAGVPADTAISSIESGPLGVVLVARPSPDDPVLVVSGDLVDWTATPVADIAGADAVWSLDVTVGADRIVVTSTEQRLDEVTPVGSRTVVGTVVRD